MAVDEQEHGEITQLLLALDRGDPSAADALLPLLYDELRRLAISKMSRESPGHTLQATALVSEVYLRLAGSKGQRWKSRGHFLAAASEAMRRILIDSARRKRSLKRGGDREREVLDDVIVVNDRGVEIEDLLSLNEALEKLEAKDPKVAALVRLRFFGGLTGQQAGEALGISHNTADAYWAYAKGWLRLATDGEKSLYLIDPDPMAFKPLASAELLGEGGDSSGIAGRIGGRTQNWAPLALSEGKLLIRDQTELKCVKVAE
ncbi:ECF-type sigma factor [Stieleria mannarensis]|uniref:ECF-type sigma factor n=1 Tax=Stieleria mannarensis TaxID=2755585 RepID=UPI00160134A9